MLGFVIISFDKMFNLNTASRYVYKTKSNAYNILRVDFIISVDNNRHHPHRSTKP